MAKSQGSSSNCSNHLVHHTFLFVWIVLRSEKPERHMRKAYAALVLSFHKCVKTNVLNFHKSVKTKMTSKTKSITALLYNFYINLIRYTRETLLLDSKRTNVAADTEILKFFSSQLSSQQHLLPGIRLLSRNSTTDFKSAQNVQRLSAIIAMTRISEERWAKCG